MPLCSPTTSNSSPRLCRPRYPRRVLSLTDRSHPTVADVGEHALIERLTGNFGPAPEGELWAGDDTAVLRDPGSSLLVTTDMLVEDIDFELEYASGSDVGFKAISASVSDVAAMGGIARWAVVSLGIPSDAPLSLADALGEGIAEAGARYGVAIVGGDISEAGETCVTSTVIGVPGQGSAVLRSGASPGEAICVTGSLGAAAGGLFVLRRGLSDPSLSIAAERKAAFERLAARQLRPLARAKAGAALAEAATSMIDLSDGLAVDLGNLCAASDTSCNVQGSNIPIDPDLDVVASTVTDDSFVPLEVAITGGEDFELLFTVASSDVADLSRIAGEVPVTVIGEMVEPGESQIAGGTLDSWKRLSWEHLT